MGTAPGPSTLLGAVPAGPIQVDPIGDRRLLEHQESSSTETVLALGRSIGLGDKFASCVLNEETRAEVDQDLQDAAKLGIAVTPTFVLNGDVVQGAQPFEAFNPRIDALLASRSL